MPPTGPPLRIVLLTLCGLLAVTLAAGLALGAVPPAADGGAQPQLDGAQPRIVELDNTSNYLQPERGDETRDGIAYQDVDVGVAVATGAETLEGRHERQAFDRRFRAAENESQRLETFADGVTTLQDRVARIRAAHAEARTSFRDGSISASEYSRTVARLDGASHRAGAYRNLLSTRIEELPPSAQFHLVDLRHLEANLDTVDGPVTSQIRARYEGNGSAGATYFTVTGDGGFVHSTVIDGLLYREAQESGEWNPGGTDGVSADLGQLLDRVEELYTWTSSHQFGYRTDFLDTSLNKIAVTHQHGELTVYIDGETGDVFREVQRNRVNAVSRDWRRSATADGIELSVEGSYETGPLEVRLTRPTGDDGVEGAVRIDGTYVGDTDDDGRLWTTQPPDGFTVNATTAGNETVSITVPDQPS